MTKYILPFYTYHVFFTIIINVGFKLTLIVYMLCIFVENGRMLIIYNKEVILLLQVVNRWITQTKI